MSNVATAALSFNKLVFLPRLPLTRAYTSPPSRSYTDNQQNSLFFFVNITSSRIVRACNQQNFQDHESMITAFPSNSISSAVLEQANFFLIVYGTCCTICVSCISIKERKWLHLQSCCSRTCTIYINPETM